MQLSDPQICAALWLSVARGSFAHAGMTGSPRYVAMLGRFAVVALQHGAGDRARTLLHEALVAVQAHPEGFKAEQGKIVYHLFDTIAAFGDAADRELLGTTLTEVLGDGVDAYVLPQKRRVQELMKAGNWAAAEVLAASTAKTLMQQYPAAKDRAASEHPPPLAVTRPAGGRPRGIDGM